MSVASILAELGKSSGPKLHKGNTASPTELITLRDVLLTEKSVRSTDLEFIWEGEISTQFSQCQALSTRIYALDEAVKSLDVQEAAFFEKDSQIVDELTWLASSTRANLRNNRKASLEASIQLLSETVDYLKSLRTAWISNTNEYLSLVEIERRVAVEFATTEIPLIGSGSFQLVTQNVYVDSLKAATGDWKKPGARENFYHYAAAYGHAWSSRRDLYLSRSMRLEGEAELNLRLSHLNSELAAARSQLDAFLEEDGSNANRAYVLALSKKRMEDTRKRPGFSYEGRTRALTAEFLNASSSLDRQSASLAFQVKRQLGIIFHPYDLIEVLSVHNADDLQLYLASFRNRLSELGMHLDQAELGSIKGATSVQANFEEMSGVARLEVTVDSPAPTARVIGISFVVARELTGRAITCKIESGSINFVSSVIVRSSESDGFSDSARLQGKVLASLGWPLVISASVQDVDFNGTTLDVVIDFQSMVRPRLGD